MTLDEFKVLSKEKQIEYMKEQISINLHNLHLNSWEFSLAHALFHYNRSFVKNSAELSILFDDLKGYFINV